MKKKLTFTLLILFSVLGYTQKSLELVDGKTFYFKNPEPYTFKPYEASIKNSDPDKLSFQLEVPTDVSNTQNIHYVVKNNFFQADWNENGLKDSLGIKFTSSAWKAMYISEKDILVLYWTNQYKSGNLAPEDVYVQYVLTSNKLDYKSYDTEESKINIKQFIADYEAKLYALLPKLQERKNLANKQEAEAKAQKHFEEELAASKDRTLFDWAFEKGAYLTEVKKLWHDGQVINTWKSKNNDRWVVYKDEYNTPVYKQHYILMLIKDENGYCYFVHNTLQMNYEGGGTYGEMFLVNRKSYYMLPRNWDEMLMVACSNIK